MKKIKISLFFFLLLFEAQAQLGAVNHWETAVYSWDQWHYFVGTTAPPVNWKETSFNHSAWPTGHGGFGYGDNDDSTVIIPTVSVYLRKEFFITDTTEIQAFILSADYDDGFVAYLNGIEMARANIGTAWVEPLYNQTADGNREALLYQGGKTEDFQILREQINYLIRPGVNVLSIQVHNQSYTSSDLSAIFFLHAGIKSTNSYFGNPPPIFEEPPIFKSYSHLPVVQLTTQGPIQINQNVLGNLAISYNDTLKQGHFKGQTNYAKTPVLTYYLNDIGAQFPKRNIKLNLVDSVGNPVEMSFFGMPPDNEWVLYGPYSDKTLIRNFLANNLAQKLFEWAPKQQAVEVMLNGYYLGVYYFIETIKTSTGRLNLEPLLSTDISGLDVTGGYLLKIGKDNDTTTNAFYTNADSIYPGYYKQSYQAVSPTLNNLHPNQLQYIKNFLTDFETSLMSKDFDNEAVGYSRFINDTSFMMNFFINEFAKNIDAFRYEVYFYKHHVKNGGVIKFGPTWDYSITFGNIDFGNELPQFYHGWVHHHGLNRLFWHIRLFDDLLYSQRTNCLWQHLRHTVFNDSIIFKTIDNEIANIGEAVNRNNYLWNPFGRYIWPNYFIGDSFQEEINYLKDWISLRLNWMDINMPNICPQPVYINELEHSQNGITIFPNPVSNNFEITGYNIDNKPVKISIFNMQGSEVYSLNNILNPLISTQNLEAGLYLAQIYFTNGNIQKFKIVKQ